VADDEGVIFIDEVQIRSQGRLETLTNGLVALPTIQFTQAREKSSGIGIDYEDRPVEGVEKHVIGRLLADALDGQQQRPEFRCGESG